MSLTVSIVNNVLEENVTRSEMTLRRKKEEGKTGDNWRGKSSVLILMYVFTVAISNTSNTKTKQNKKIKIHSASLWDNPLQCQHCLSMSAKYVCLVR